MFVLPNRRDAFLVGGTVGMTPMWLLPYVFLPMPPVVLVVLAMFAPLWLPSPMGGVYIYMGGYPLYKLE